MRKGKGRKKGNDEKEMKGKEKKG